MGRKILAGVLAFVVLVVLGFFAYGWWTRRKPVTFSKGGAFGTVAPSETETATATATGTIEPSVTPTAATPSPSPSKTAAKTTAPTAKPSGPVLVTAPKDGTYIYRAQGNEKVKFGPVSPCGWDLNEIKLVVKKDASGSVQDWTYSSNHQEREIYSYRPDGAYVTFTGSRITCMGVAQGSEEDYVPPAKRWQSPMKVGDTWSTKSQAGSRTETATVKVTGIETITVPAGTFLTYRMEVTIKFTGDQSGGIDIVGWYSASLNVNIKETYHLTAQSSGANYTSDFVMQLASTP